MKSWLWASRLFAVGYLIGTAVGFATYAIGIVVMWLSLFVAMPPLFAYLCRLYLTRVRCVPECSRSETWRLVAYWILLSFGLDALTYIVALPAALHAKPNWTFFMDQSPWIWISYASLIVSGQAGRRLHDRHLKQPSHTGLKVA